MLAEMIEYLLTPCPPEARKLGYLKEAVAIRARHRRCRQAWREHLTRCRAAIVEATKTSPGRGTALVLGSGALLDIPLEVLAGIFDTVVLADIVHPLGARLKARALPGVRLDTADLTGTLGAVSRGILPDLAPIKRYLDLSPDFTVSANILSQLPLIPARALNRTGCCPRERVQAFSTGVQREHLAWLERFPGVKLLITDTAWRDGPDVADPLHGLTLPPAWRSWTWNIAPRPEAHRDRDVIHEVSAFLM